MLVARGILDRVFDDIHEVDPAFDASRYRDILVDSGWDDEPISPSDHVDGDLAAWAYAAHKFLGHVLETELQCKSWMCGFANWASASPNLPSQGFLQFLSERLSLDQCVSDSQVLMVQVLDEIRFAGTVDWSLLSSPSGALFRSTIEKLDFLLRSLRVLDYARIIDRHLELRKLRHGAASLSESTVKTVECAHTILEDRRSELNLRERKELEGLLYNSARKHGVLPSTFYIKDVRRLEEHPIGGGGYGDVYKGRVGRLDVAVKVSRCLWDSKEKERRYRELCKEAIIWKPLKHPYILPFFGLCAEGFPSIGLVSPYMHNGDLLAYLKRNPSVNKKTVMEQVCLGLEYLHNNEPPIVHGDLKCANVLVDVHGNPRIADFGLARLIGVASLTASSRSRGTLRWQAPELVYPSEHGGDGLINMKTDIYAFGMTCLEIFTKKVPFHGMTDWEVAIMARDGSALDHALKIVQGTWMMLVLECCCETDPYSRFHMRDVLESIFWTCGFRDFQMEMAE